jgi:hypothetical protein
LCGLCDRSLYGDNSAGVLCRHAPPLEQGTRGM